MVPTVYIEQCIRRFYNSGALTTKGITPVERDVSERIQVVVSMELHTSSRESPIKMASGA